MNDTVASVAISLVIFILGFGMGAGIVDRANERSAIKAGVGEYVLANETSVTADFRWKTNFVYITNNVFVNATNK